MWVGLAEHFEICRSVDVTFMGFGMWKIAISSFLVDHLSGSEWDARVAPERNLPSEGGWRGGGKS